MDLGGEIQSTSEVIPEIDAQLGGGFDQTEECIATGAPDIAACSAADFSLGHLTSDVTLGSVGM